jgi:hypothetical protein
LPSGAGLAGVPELQKKVRVAIDWMLDLIFSKDIVELPTLRSPTITAVEESAAATTSEQQLSIR